MAKKVNSVDTQSGDIAVQASGAGVTEEGNTNAGKTLSTEIARLTQAKADIKAAIEAKGVTVGNGTIDTYASKIGEISSGGGSDYVPLITSINLPFLRYDSFQSASNQFNKFFESAYFVTEASGDRLDVVLSNSLDSWQYGSIVNIPYGVIRRFSTSNMYIQHNTFNTGYGYADFEFFKITKDLDEVVYSMTNSIGFEQDITEPYEFPDVDLSDAILCGIRLTAIYTD